MDLEIRYENGSMTVHLEEFLSERRIAKVRKQVECEAADKRAYDLIKVLKYIIKGAGFELTERVQVKDTKTGRVYR